MSDKPYHELVKLVEAQRQQIAKLEAENERLQNDIVAYRDYTVGVINNLQSAQYWARHYRRKYLHVKANVLNPLSDYLMATPRPDWLPEDDPDYRPF